VAKQMPFKYIGDGLALMPFNLVLDWVLRKTEVDLSSTLLYKSVQIEGYADNLNIQGRSSAVVGAAKQIGLTINCEKTKAMV
jgi:hypothetical protein